MKGIYVKSEKCEMKSRNVNNTYGLFEPFAFLINYNIVITITNSCFTTRIRITILFFKKNSIDKAKDITY